MGHLLLQQALSSGWCPGSCDWSVSVVPGQLRHWFYCLFHPLPDLNPIKYLWDTMYCCTHRCHIAPQTSQELTDALIRVWEEIPLETICHLISRVPRFCWECIQAHGVHTHYWTAVWVGLRKYDPVSDLIFPIGFSSLNGLIQVSTDVVTLSVFHELHSVIQKRFFDWNISFIEIWDTGFECYLCFFFYYSF